MSGEGLARAWLATRAPFYERAAQGPTSRRHISGGRHGGLVNLTPKGASKSPVEAERTVTKRTIASSRTSGSK